ncbi:MAG: UbiA family prenyltransferase [Steroidobacteraceae bacterium]
MRRLRPGGVAQDVQPDPARLPTNPAAVAWVREQISHGAVVTVLSPFDDAWNHAWAQANELQCSFAGESQSNLTQPPATASAGPAGRRGPSRLKSVLRVMRVHQWLKNLLLFVPLFTGFSLFDLTRAPKMILAFLAFSCVASATYVVNDLWDIDSDRAHARKVRRPLASGQLSVVAALWLVVVLAFAGFALASMVSHTFAWIVVLYVAATLTYSSVLKSIVLIDAVTLSLFYALRMLAGGVAADIPLSTWLIAFALFIFLSLALLKRCSELIYLQSEARASAAGRDYQVKDLAVLWPLGVSSAIAAVVVFGLFISQPDTQARYATPELLWLVAVALIYWCGRLWIKANRGEMHDDPIIFALRNRGSLVTLAAMIGITVLAQFVSLRRLVEWIEY